ncbi:MAG: acyl-CoA dehydrogenase family protein [Candidatus Omnitrophica bacterium]|nr:acyl-CoA dehydrogenase family protein [Candidatus Omnitrophota bacterium]
MTTPATDPHALLGKGSPEALEVTEAARETEWHYPSLVADLFMGHLRSELVFPYPEQPEDDRRIGDEFIARLEAFLKEHVDPEEIDRTSEMPAQVIQGLARLGCFGMKIPKEYGGLGLSQTNYNRSIAVVGSYCSSTAVWLSAHQSIGAPQPIMLFGTDDQKRRYLPRLAQGTISAFALTEPGAGSDPANMTTTATPVEGGEWYVLNGEKLWCTNGPVADVVVVMARTPSITVGGRERKQITAFIVERSMPGFEATHRCSFMGLHGIQNGVLRFTNVRVPKSNILWGTGLGLKLALVTLNAGRIAIPAGCVGAAKRCLQISRQWAKERKQWGGSIGKHEAIAVKIGEMAATIFAMDAMVGLTSGLVDRKTIDIRLEAAIAKLYCSEASWRIIDAAVQIRGGRGYETSHSLRARGEAPYPLERMMRDARINLIIEGTSEIMRLFIAREALDAHMRIVSQLMNPHVSLPKKATAALVACGRYAVWYPRQWCSWGWWPRYASLPPTLASHMRFVERTSHRVARALIHSAMRHGMQLANRQQLLGRIVDAGAELFAMVAACSKAYAMTRLQPSEQSPVELADLFCRLARRRVTHTLQRLHDNEDGRLYNTAQDVLSGRYAWLEEGIV